MRTVFITGNKRSGTSQLVKLLNLHPRVFMSHESDIIWILYQFHNDMPFAAHPWDSPRGMNTALKTCGLLLEKNNGPEQNYFAFQQCLKENWNSRFPASAKKDVLWIGDKKPFQNADPKLTEFIFETLPDPHFIHLVRHPFAVAASSERFNRTPYGDFWKGLTPEEKVAQWTFHEKNVSELKRTKKAKVIDVKYEDLCRKTEDVMAEIFRFLGLEFDGGITKTARSKTRYIVKNMPSIRCSEETIAIMSQYGYKTEGTQKSMLGLYFANLIWKLRKHLS